MSGIGGGAESLGIGKAGDGFEGIESAGRSELDETGDRAGQLKLSRAGDGGAGGGRMGDGKGSNSGVNNSKTGDGRGRDGKRGNIGALEKSSLSGLI